MKKQFYKWIFFRLMGWKIVGGIDANIKKCVMMVMPHTSAHDFYLGIFTRGITGLEMNWVGKKELFRFPFGFYFRYMGGEPLDRSGGLNKVDSIAAIFQRKEIFRLAVEAPLRFSSLLRQIEGSNKQTLSVALRELEEVGLLEKVVIQQKPLHIEYNLTEKGKSIKPVFKQLESLG